MAGGPGTPALAAAVSAAGGLGFVAAGYLSAQRLAEDIAAARALGSGPLGVNLFVPQPSLADPQRIEAYRERLRPVAARWGAEVGAPRFDDDAWAEKLQVVADMRPEVVSFTFGCAEPATVASLRGLGVATVATVTSVEEAQTALAAGVDALIVQGPGAGGHRGTFDPGRRPPTGSLESLLGEVLKALEVCPVPVIAAGGVAGGADVARLLSLGAVAVQVGTALLLAEEAGTNPVHRRALQSGVFAGSGAEAGPGTRPETVVTRAFSGRYARGLRNEFTDAFDALAPPGYPEVHYVTSPIRKAAVAAGDPHGTNLWAGTGFRRTRASSAAAIVADLAGVNR